MATKAEEMRKKRNANLVDRMNKGEDLAAFNTALSWYPPRPIIKKNAEDIRKLYGNDAKVVEARDDGDVCDNDIDDEDEGDDE